MSKLLSLIELKKAAKAAIDEVELSITYHEVWRLAAQDAELHKRISHSYAATAFLVVRRALRSETILAMMRMWDGTKMELTSISLPKIALSLRDTDTFEHIVAERSKRFKVKPNVDAGLDKPEILLAMRADMQRKTNEVIDLVSKYSKGGSHHAVFVALRMLRDQHLAHRQIERPATKVDEMTNEIEEFYKDHLIIAANLSSIILGVAYDLKSTADNFAFYANLFWAPVQSERNEGHPNYKGKRRE